jgi:hypothetical protein
VPVILSCKCFPRVSKILTLTYNLLNSSEKKILNETKNHKPPLHLQVKWSVPNVANIIHMSISVSQRSNIICLIFQIIATLFNKLYVLGYMTKTLNQIIVFFLHQNQDIFFSNFGNQNIFLEKNHNPPLQVKWSFFFNIINNLGSLVF